MAIGERPEDLEKLRSAFGEIEKAYGNVFPDIKGKLTGSLPGASNERKGYTPAQNKARGMKAGGTASARADGCAIKGKTKGKIV